MPFEKFQSVVNKISAERIRQLNKWGEQRHSDETWLVILTEEVGELAKEILEVRFDGKSSESMRKELIQCAAVCAAWLEVFEE